MIRRPTLFAAAVACLGFGFVAPTVTANNDDVCPQGAPWTAHQFDATGSSHTVTAPDGYAIVAVCVKAGSAQHGDGPEILWFDPPVPSVTFSHSTGKDISHYSVKFTPVQNGTTTTEATTSTTSTAPSTSTTTTSTTTSIVGTTTTTEPAATSTSVAATTTASTTSSVATTSTLPPTASTNGSTLPPTSTPPSEPSSTSIVPPPSSTTPGPTPTTAPSGDCSAPPSSANTAPENCGTPSLPATGPADVVWYLAALATLLTAIGTATHHWNKSGRQ